MSDDTSATNAETGSDDNPLLSCQGLPRYDCIEPNHVVPGVRAILTHAGEKLRELQHNLTPDWDGLLKPLEEIGHPFEFGWQPVSHLFGVKNSPELREAYEEVLNEVVLFGLQVKQSQPFYKALKAIKEGPEWDGLDEAQRRVIDDKLLATELAGIGLEGKDRERFNEIAQELSQLGTEFSNHVLDAVKEYSLVLTEQDEVAGIPESLRQLTAQSYNSAKQDDEPEATPEAGPWRLTLDVPCFVPFMQHANRRDLREAVYRAFIARASSGKVDNAPLIPQILKLRQEEARLLGFENYAQVSLAEKMAPDVTAVAEMYETLRTASWEPAQKDMADLQQLADAEGIDEPLAHWDLAFWSERLREQRFDYTEEELRPYFALENVLNGLFALVERLFGIKVTAADGKAPVWNEDVRYFEISDEAGAQIAAFYLDPYSRPENKRGGAWMDECLSRRIVEGRLQLPVAQLVCNSTPPVGEIPSLMTFREVETLFHEFGHGLQHMLTTVDYADASGISGVEWDAVELASQFMENWCYHRPTLMGLTAHYQTGEQLPDDLFEKITAARTFQAGTMMLRQLRFGMIDMHLHTQFNPDGEESVLDVQRRITAETSVMPMLEEDRMLCSFQHIFAGGYAAGYYSYKWSEVLSADAFSAFEEAGLDNERAVRETGRRYRDTVLAMGGGRHPMDVFRDFQGREPNPGALLRHNGLA
ncbi:MAG: peptidase M3 [Planctomycetaceae bacterium]|nr:peptidase M3 [Planctomycetaceae bacterium]